MKNYFKRLATGKHKTDDFTRVRFDQVLHQKYFTKFHKNKEDFQAKAYFDPMDVKLMANIDVIFCLIESISSIHIFGTITLLLRLDVGCNLDHFTI